MTFAPASLSCDVTVPSVFPGNVSLQLNESVLVVRWRPPPADKINGILTGYDVIVSRGLVVDKVS